MSSSSKETDFERKFSFLHSYNECSDYAERLGGTNGVAYPLVVFRQAAKMKNRIDSLLENQKASTGSEEEALSTFSQKVEDLLTHWNVEDNGVCMSLDHWKEDETSEKGLRLASEMKDLLSTIEPFLKTIESLEKKHPEMDIQAEPPKLSCSVAINPGVPVKIKHNENGDVTIEIFGPPSNK